MKKKVLLLTGLLAGVSIIQAATFDPPVGETIVLFSNKDSAFAILDGGNILLGSAESALCHFQHFLVEDAGDGTGYIRLKSLKDNLYVTREIGVNGNPFCYATVAEADKETIETRWEWVEDADGLDLRYVGTGKYVYSANGSKLRVEAGSPAGRFQWMVAEPDSFPKLDFRIIDADPRWPTEERIMAAALLTDRVDNNDTNSPSLFGLPADPANEDCTAAFDAAIEYIARGGGGTLFIPAGQYRVDGPIKLRDTVQLRGRWCAPHDGVDELGYTYAEKLGTVIRIQNTGSEEATITGSTIQDLTFWYPDQNPETGITPYPWTLMKGSFSPKAYYHRITLLNAYKGIYVAEGSAADVRHIYGSAYEVGIRVNPNYALAAYENFNFSPDYLAWSGLASGPAINAHKTATRAGGSAIEMSRVGVGSFVKGHRVGFTCFKVDGQGNLPLSSVGNADLRDCQTGVLFNHSKTGWSVNGSTITNCDVAISAPYGGNLNLSNTKLLDSAVYDADGVTNKLDVAILAGSIADPAKMNLNGGSVTDNAFAEEEDPDAATDDTEFETKLTVPAYKADSRDLLVWDIFNVKAPEFGAIGDGLNDDTAAVQAAIAAANANGGGVVMFPGGHYLVKTNLTTLGAGVELRGALDWRVLQNTPTIGSYLWVDVPDFADHEEDEEAFIRLGDRSGVRGMSFYYPNQVGGSPFKKYPFTIQGNGVRNYVIYCSAVNPYRFINFNGDDNLLAYSFPTAQREVVFVNGNRDGRFIRNNPKPYWDSSFPRPASAESYVREITREGMVMMHLKDCDDYGSAWGSYCHGGYLGLLVENSGGNFGRLSLEAYRNGHLFVSGDKEIIICDKNASRARPGPIDGEETFYIKTLEGFEGTVIAHSGNCDGSFAKTLDVQGGTVHTVGGKMQDQTPQVIEVGAMGTLIVEEKAFKDPVMVKNEGSMKLINCTGASMLNVPYAQEFETDNNLETGAAYNHMGFWPIRSYGLMVETNGLEFVPAYETVQTQPYSKGKTTTTNGVFNITVEEPTFFNDSPNSVSIVFDGYIPAVSTLQVSYYSGGSWVDLDAVTYSNSDDNISFTLPNPSFGQQLPEHADLPDIRLAVLAGDSPKLEHVKLKTALYGTPVPASIGDLEIAAGPNPTLIWSAIQEPGYTYNIYRRSTSSGAFGAPIATVAESTFQDAGVAGDTKVYTYGVTAVKPGGGESAISFEVSTDWPDVPAIITRTLPAAFLDREYSSVLLANGEYPFEWSVVDGSLPPGMALYANGYLGGTPGSEGSWSFTVQAEDRDGGDADTQVLSLEVRQRLPVFLDDFEDDTPLDSTNTGLDIRADVDGAGEDVADVGYQYSSPFGEYQIRANPETNGNSSSHVLFMNQIGSGTQDAQYINGLFGASYPLDGMEIRFDFYNTNLSGDNLYSEDAVRFYLVGENNASVECAIVLKRNGGFSIDGTTITGAAPVTNAWHRFAGTFNASATPGEYDLEWTLENLETASSASGTTPVDLNDGNWGANALDPSMANGIRLYVHDKKNSESYMAYFDNVSVSLGGGQLDSYDAWADIFGGSATIGMATNDYDGDGLPNLEEYALGGNPMNAMDGGEPLELLHAGGALLFIHPQRAADAGLSYRVETRTNLVSGSWSASGSMVAGTNQTGSVLDYVTNAVPVDVDRKFIQLKIIEE